MKASAAIHTRLGKFRAERQSGSGRQNKKPFRITPFWKDRMISTAFLAPSAIGVLIFFVAPFAVIIYYSFIDNVINQGFRFNYIDVLNNDAFRLAARNTLSFSAMALPFAVVLSLLLAMLLDTRIPLRSTFRTLFLCPMMVPVASVVLIWNVIFHYNGALNGFLANFGIEQIDWFKSEYSMIVIVILFLWKNLGYNMILFLAAINNIPRGIMEAATVDGAGPFLIFWKIKLRYLSPTILFVTIFSLINSFKVFREVYLLTDNYPYGGVYLLQHYMNNKFASLDYPLLSAAAIIMTVAMVVIIGALFIAEYKFGEDVEG